MLYTPQYCSAHKSENSSIVRSQSKSQRGMTLIELMVSISLTCILTTVALTNLDNFIVQLRVDNEISHLTRLLLTARNHAINSENNVIICPLSNRGSCTTNWHKELSVFVDSNNNKRFDGINNELLVTQKSPIKLGDVLTYANNRTKITYQASGYLFGLSNGTFRYCPKGHKDKSRGVVIAPSGRFYATTDINNDGKDETRSKQGIACN